MNSSTIRKTLSCGIAAVFLTTAGGWTGAQALPASPAYVPVDAVAHPVEQVAAKKKKAVKKRKVVKRRNNSGAAAAAAAFGLFAGAAAAAAAANRHDYYDSYYPRYRTYYDPAPVPYYGPQYAPAPYYAPRPVYHQRRVYRPAPVYRSQPHYSGPRYSAPGTVQGHEVYVPPGQNPLFPPSTHIEGR